VELDKTSKKIVVKDDDSSTVPNVFAIGDCAKGRPELTPTAIMAGKMLARRLFNHDNLLMDYKNVATTVFTPLEYGCIGYSEEDAIAKYGGEENLTIYNSTFKPLEWNFLETRLSTSCYIKMICDKTDALRILGLHYLGPNAGEVIQGYAVAIKMGATKHDFDATVGIHPTTSEEILGLSVTKGEGDGETEGC